MIKAFVGYFLPSLVFGDEKEMAKIYPIGPILKHLLEESGYFHIQATRPDTVGEHVAALNFNTNKKIKPDLHIHYLCWCRQFRTVVCHSVSRHGRN